MAADIHQITLSNITKFNNLITSHPPATLADMFHSRLQESMVQVREEEIRTRDLGLQIELDVRLALDSLRSADSQVQTAREGLTLAQSELEQAQRRYQAGVANSLEVTDAQTRLDRARDNQVDALYNHNLARLELATATGAIQGYVQK